MPKFRKRPVVIEAVQYRDWMRESGDLPEGVNVVYWREGPMGEGDFPTVTTVHGQQAIVQDGDWIIAEPVPGRFYPCKPDIFAATYEAIEAVKPMTNGQAHACGREIIVNAGLCGRVDQHYHLPGGGVSTLAPIAVNDFGGAPAAAHNMPCGVCRGQPAVLELNVGRFSPCWSCQAEGWRTLRVPRWVAWLFGSRR